MFAAYLVTNSVDGKRYIGITAASVLGRWKKHVAQSVRIGRRTCLLHLAIAKHGASSFLLEHIASAVSWDDLCDLEVVLIAQHQTFFRDGGGYNMTRGGEGPKGRISSAATREKIGMFWRGKKRSPRTPEHCANLAAAKTGVIRGPHTAEHREKIGAAQRGRPGVIPSEETRKRLSLSHMGKTATQETRDRMSAAAKGKIKTPEHRAALSASHKARHQRGQLELL